VSVTIALTSAGVMFLVDLTSAKYVLVICHAVLMSVGSAYYKPAGDAGITGCEVVWLGRMVERDWRKLSKITRYANPNDSGREDFDITRLFKIEVVGHGV